MPKNKQGYYRVTITLGKDSNGKPKRLDIRAKTKRELDERYAEAKRLYSKGVSGGEITVVAWGERWLSVYKANASATMKAHYRAKLHRDINPVIGSMPMRDIRASDLQALLNSYAGGKVSTVNKIRMAIKQLFEYAEIEGIIERNPASRIELPPLTESPRRPLNGVERSVVWRVAQSHERGAYILTMLLCGLRRGECLALTVGDIDFDRRRISVTKSISMAVNAGIIKDPKSKAGFRETPLPELLIPYLKKQCEGRDTSAPVFPRANGGFATRQTAIWWWNSFSRACHIEAGAELYRNKVLVETSPFGNDITPHFLRHSYATDLYAAGIDEKARKYFLGHASSDVTDIYTKVNDEAFSKAAALLNTYLNSSVEKMWNHDDVKR